MNFTDNTFLDVIITVGILLLSVMLHEVSHGYVARLLGDNTAKDAGRLTLNPIKHIDPLGSVIFPALLALAGSTIFGWAKPVPVNPSRFERPTSGMAITSLAGPATNLALAFIAGRFILGATSGFTREVVGGFIIINLFLAVFNMLPIPPLDGSKLLPLFLTENGRAVFYRVSEYGFLILFGLIFLLPRSLSFMTDIVNWLIPVVVA